jgi:hypothetical protein
MSQVKISMGGKLHNPKAIGYNFATGQTNLGLGGPMDELLKPHRRNNRTAYKWVTLPDGRKVQVASSQDGQGKRQKQPIKMWHGGWEWM